MCVDVVETSRLCFFSGIHFMDSQIPKLALHFNRGRRSLKEIIPDNRWGVQKFSSFSMCFLHYASNFPTAVPNDTAVHVSLPYAASQATSNNITRCNSGFKYSRTPIFSTLLLGIFQRLKNCLGASLLGVVAFPIHSCDSLKFTFPSVIQGVSSSSMF